jgi:hypothetical protein
MSGIAENGYSENTPLNFGISVWAPSSALNGSPALFYFQPLLYGKFSTAVLIGAQLLLFIAKRFFGLEEVSILYPGPKTESRMIKIPVPKLQKLLVSLSQNSESDNNTSLNNFISQTSSSALPNQTYGGFLTTQTPEIPIIVGITVAGDYSNKPFSPSIFFSLPIFVLQGIRGTLPIIILGLIGTIFVRAVVPPELSGAKPLK